MQGKGRFQLHGGCHNVTSLADEEGRSEHLIVIARNIREREEYERLLEHQANHDALTGLPNRLLFAKELASVLSHHGEAA